MYPYLSYKGRGSSWVEMRRQRPTATPEDFNGLVQLAAGGSFVQRLCIHTSTSIIY